MKRAEKPSLKETWKLNIRCIKDLNHYCPGLFLSCLLRGTFFHLKPFVIIFLSARIIDELAGPCRANVLWRWAIIAVIMEGVLLLTCNILRRWESARLDVCQVQRSRIFSDKMMALDFADIDNQKTYDKLSQIRQNEYTFGWGMGKSVYILRDIFAAFLKIAGAITLTVSLFTLPVPEEAGALTVLDSPVFILLLLLIMGAITLTIPFLQNKMTNLFADAAEQNRLGNNLASFFGWKTGDVSRAMDIRIYKQQSLIQHYHKKSVEILGVDGIHAQIKAKPIGYVTALIVSTSTLFTGVVYMFVCMKAWAGAFGVGSITQYVAAITAFSNGISQMLTHIGKLQSNTRFLRTAYEFLDVPNTMYRGSLPTEKRDDREYVVEFKDVSFKYPGSDLWALRHVNMKLKVGKRLAIVGENGSGKTTFIKLLCRLYDPQQGQILLNGIDIRKYNYRDYMDVFSVVFQDFQLLSQPLGANVAGSSEYDADRVIQALTDAGFGDRLTELPDGLETMLYKDFGENGVDISGGEAQKIAIARALYKDAPFIILDEPTAALDPVAEAEIYSKFNDIAGDKTAIYISHRLSSCKFCDEIAVFHEGSVIQQGTHAELVADETGKYYELWHAQAQYYTEKTA